MNKHMKNPRNPTPARSACYETTHTINDASADVQSSSQGAAAQHMTQAWAPCRARIQDWATEIEQSAERRLRQPCTLSPSAAG